MSAHIIRTVTAADVEAYIALGGAPPAGGEVPEPLIASLFSYLLGVRLPGAGTNYLKQSIEFPAPARTGQALTARVEIMRLRPEKHLIDLETTCRLADDTVIAKGRALVSVRDVADVRSSAFQSGTLRR
jgi:acyl dehydratase